MILFKVFLLVGLVATAFALGACSEHKKYYGRAV